MISEVEFWLEILIFECCFYKARPLKISVFTMVFEGPPLTKHSKIKIFNQHIVSKIILNFYTVFGLHFAGFWHPFGILLEPLLLTFGVLGCLGVGFRSFWASFVVNLGVLGATWSPWGRLGVAFGWIWTPFWSISWRNPNTKLIKTSLNPD